MQAVVVLVLGFTKMGMEAAIVFSASATLSLISRVVTVKGAQGASATWMKAPSRVVVIARQHPLAIGKNGIFVLNDAIGRQSAVFLAESSWSRE